MNMTDPRDGNPEFIGETGEKLSTAEAVKILLHITKLSRPKLAALLGCSHRTVEGWCMGREIDFRFKCGLGGILARHNAGEVFGK